MKETTKELSPPQKAVQRELGRYIPLLEKYGITKQEIADKLSLATKQKITRQMIGRWLNPEPEKRTQALHGTGILLVKLLKELCP